MAQYNVSSESMSEPLVGANGMTFVSETLSSEHPQVAVRKIQAKAGLNGLCIPLLGLVDSLGITRADAHRAVLASSKSVLQAQIVKQGARLSSGSTREEDKQQLKAKLERLLNASFHYLGLQELREVPISVMNTLEQVPPIFLKQLTADKQIFKELPGKVQRQVWEFDKNLLQQDALPPVGQYKYEVATVMRAMAMDEFIPALLQNLSNGVDEQGGEQQHQQSGQASDAGSRSNTKPTAVTGASASGVRGGVKRPAVQQGWASGRPMGITRKILRKGSRVLQVLKGMVGGSAKIYGQIVELCIVKYRDSETLYIGAKELSYCTLRSQLLMALHDDNSSVAAKDRCHELAWTLDAGIMNGRLTDKHLNKLEKYFKDVDSAEQRSAEALRGARSGALDEAESAGNNASGRLAEPYKVLGEAGVILRDPSAMHLLIATALQLSLHPALTEGILPSNNPRLLFVLRLLQLAVESRNMLRDRKYRLPDPDPYVLHDMLPMLCTLAMDVEVDDINVLLKKKQRKDGNPESSLESLPSAEIGVEYSFGDEQVSLKGMKAITKSEVARKLAQVFVLERLMREDYLSATRVLRMLAQATTHKAAYEMFDFAGTLAQKLAELVKAKRLQPSSSLWLYAVDNILIKAVDSQTQVHEEVLRLLLVSAPVLAPEQLGMYLKMTLDNSKKSRKRLKKHLSDPMVDFTMSLMGEVGSDVGSDGWPGIMALKSKSSDAVRSIYTKFKSVKGINIQTAPALFEYLEEDGSHPRDDCQGSNLRPVEARLQDSAADHDAL